MLSLALESKNGLLPSMSRQRATAIQVLGGYANIGIVIVQGLLLVPMYIHFIGAHLYGLWLASGGVLGMLGVLNFGVSSLLIQRVAGAYGKNDLSQVGAYFINGMFVYMLIAVGFILTGWVLSFGLQGVLHLGLGAPTELRACFQIAVFATGIGLLNECLRAFPQALLRPLFPAVAMAVFRILGIGVTVILLLRHMGLWALPIGMLVTEILLLVSGSIQAVSLFCHIRAKVCIDMKLVREYFHVGGALVLAKLGHGLSKESDPVLVTYFFTPELTTAYMLTRRIADVVSQMLGVVYGATHAAFSHLVGQGDNRKSADVAMKLLVGFFILSLVGFVTYVGVNFSFVSLWVGESFVLTQEIILFTGLAYLAASVRNMVLQTVNGIGSEYNYSSAILFIEGGGRILLAVVLLSFAGIVGLPISLMIAAFLSLAVLWTKLKSRLQLTLTSGNVVKAIVLLCGLFTLAQVVAINAKAGESWLALAMLMGGLLFTVSMIAFFSNRALLEELGRAYLIRRP